MSLALRTCDAISEEIPASTASPIKLNELGNLQRVLRADSISKIRLLSEITSLLNESPKYPLYGEINWLKNESIVPIGASSSSVSNCSLNPWCLILGSVRFIPSSPIGPGFNLEILLRNLSRISSEARLVKVKSTTSPGNKPPHFCKSIVSETGDRSNPPSNLDGLSGAGSILVAL